MNQQNPSEPVTIFMPSGQRIGAQRAGLTRRPAGRDGGKSYTEAAPGGVAIFVAVPGIGPKQGTAVIRTFVPNRGCGSGVVQAWLLLGLVAIGLLAMAVIVAAQLTRSLVRPLGERRQGRRAAGPAGT